MKEKPKVRPTSEDYTKPVAEIDRETKLRGKRRREAVDYTDTVKPTPIKEVPRKKKGWDNAFYEDTETQDIFMDGQWFTPEEFDELQLLSEIMSEWDE